MALSGTLSAAYRGWTYRIDWTATQSVADNTSEVTCVHKLVCASGYNLSIGSRSNSCTVGGVKKDFTSAAISTIGGTTHTLGTTKHLLTHNDDGSKSASVSGAFNVQATLSDTYKASIQVSGTITLDDIPRASQPSLVTWPETTNNVGDFGANFAIHMNRNADSFTHTVRYEYGTRTGTIATGVATGTTWAVPLAWMNDIPAAVKASGRIYVDTYNGSKLIGTKYTGFTVTVPASVKPTCSIQVLDAAGLQGKYGNLVKGYSKLQVKTTGTPAYGSPMAAYNVTANGQRYTAADITTGTLTATGTTKVTATVTDKRGRTSAEASASFTVLDYAKPTVSALRVHRCDADGTENDQGEFVEVIFSAAITPLNNKNGASYSLRYKKSKETTYTEVPFTDLAKAYTVTNKSYIFAADSSSSYDIEVEATDDLASAIRATSASTAFTLIHLGADGESLGFCKLAERPGAIDVGTNVYLNNHALYGSHGMLDTRSTNQPPSWYQANHGNGAVWEFKELVAVGFTAPSTKYGPMETLTPWKDASGGLPRQVIYEGRTRWTRIATSADAWGAWQSDALLAYPVGSIYLAYNHTDPATLFGGTWERLQNTFLWAVDASGTIGQTGGEREHTLTVNELPAHSHGSVYSQHAPGTKSQAWYTTAGSALAYGAVSTGGGEAHNNMPPYTQISVWRRTA